jgi:hypothetical protein
MVCSFEAPSRALHLLFISFCHFYFDCTAGVSFRVSGYFIGHGIYLIILFDTFA